MNKLGFERQLIAFFMQLNFAKYLQNYSIDKSFQSYSVHPMPKYLHILDFFNSTGSRLIKSESVLLE